MLRCTENYCKGRNVKFNFLLIDVFGAFDSSDFPIPLDDLKEKIHHSFENTVHLIIFTIRNESSSPEELQVLNYILSMQIGDSAYSICSLVVTACESIGLSKLDGFLDSMKTTNKDTKQFFDCMQKSVIGVSFPTVDDAEEEEIKQIYLKKIKWSDEKLENLLRDCKEGKSFEDIFKLHHIKGSFLLPKRDISPTCVPS